MSQFVIVSSYTGQPDLHRLKNIIGRVEHAALYDNNVSFLDYKNLCKKGIGSYHKGLVMEIRRHFYETTTPKSPIQVKEWYGKPEVSPS